MKAILVIDMPNSCDECKFETEMLNCGKPMCVATPHRRERIEDDSTRPSWCPLKLLPKQFTLDEILMAKDVKTAIEMRAYNDYREEITGDSE